MFDRYAFLRRPRLQIDWHDAFFVGMILLMSVVVLWVVLNVAAAEQQRILCLQEYGHLHSLKSVPLKCWEFFQ